MLRSLRSRHRYCYLWMCLTLVACGSDTPDTPEPARRPPIVVYSSRDAGALRSVFDAYTAESGVPVLLTTESGRTLADRLTTEKHGSTADLVLTDGIGYLWTAADEDNLRPSHSDVLSGNIPGELRDPENQWYGLLVFARTIVYDKRVVDPYDLTGYAALGDDRWGGSLCLSSADNVDNETLVAMMIAEHGDRPTELIVRSWIRNLAISPVADDIALLQKMEAGRCSLGLVNSDDALRLARDNPDTAVSLYWPPASAGGAYIDVVGAAVTRHASNADGAHRLLEWLSTKTGLRFLAAQGLEYPANEELPIENIRAVNLAGAAYYHEDAVKLMVRAGWRH
jgi:iron(III) transport system substrate-binding protein